MTARRQATRLAGVIRTRAIRLSNLGHLKNWARQAIAAGPSNPGPYQALAAALALTGHETEAQDALQHYLALPSNRRAGTIAALKAYNVRFANVTIDPRVPDNYDRLYEGLRKSGAAGGVKVSGGGAFAKNSRSSTGNCLRQNRLPALRTGRNQARIDVKR